MNAVQCRGVSVRGREVFEKCGEASVLLVVFGEAGVGRNASDGGFEGLNGR